MPDVKILSRSRFSPPDQVGSADLDDPPPKKQYAFFANVRIVLRS